MTRLVYLSMFAFALCFSAVGCGSSGNTVIEDTRSPAEIQQELDDYDKQMEDAAASDVKK
ncbi:hypothetical protein [Stieleria varia]|uniref:Secreted protein n=1 Tax=Stieleria varia TaxID=2528005 RepID=A0A5C6B122_9BACT|nr:hypothetical protein [Stieleria varia]TWU06005.1 hypothetical protein Pla52n_17210 [Stieleria varia]